MILDILRFSIDLKIKTSSFFILKVVLIENIGVSYKVLITFRSYLIGQFKD